MGTGFTLFYYLKLFPNSPFYTSEVGLLLYEMNFMEWFPFTPGGLSVLRKTIKDSVFFRETCFFSVIKTLGPFMFFLDK